VAGGFAELVPAPEGGFEGCQILLQEVVQPGFPDKLFQVADGDKPHAVSPVLSVGIIGIMRSVFGCCLE
jgi:hypothetical protein